MALTNCPKCGDMVSDRAERCPHCGYIFRIYKPANQHESRDNSNIIESSTNPRRGVSFIWIAVIVAVLIAGVLVFNYLSEHSSQDSLAETADVEDNPADAMASNDNSTFVDTEISPLRKIDNEKSERDFQNYENTEEQLATQQTMVSETPVGNAVPNYFYVVIGSFQTLGEAKNFVNNASDITCGNIYSAVSEGRTLYRVCSACYPSKSEAKRKVEQEKNYFRSRGDYDRQPWVWSTNHRERCVYRPITENDRYLPNFCDLN